MKGLGSSRSRRANRIFPEDSAVTLRRDSDGQWHGEISCAGETVTAEERDLLGLCATLAERTTILALAARVALVRQRDSGSAWVSHAHDLHD
jgi:hypothetical protein